MQLSKLNAPAGADQLSRVDVWLGWDSEPRHVTRSGSWPPAGRLDVTFFLTPHELRQTMIFVNEIPRWPVSKANYGVFVISGWALDWLGKYGPYKQSLVCIAARLEDQSEEMAKNRQEERENFHLWLCKYLIYMEMLEIMVSKC